MYIYEVSIVKCILYTNTTFLQQIQFSVLNKFCFIKYMYLTKFIINVNMYRAIYKMFTIILGTMVQRIKMLISTLMSKITPIKKKHYLRSMRMKCKYYLFMILDFFLKNNCNLFLIFSKIFRSQVNEYINSSVWPLSCFHPVGNKFPIQPIGCLNFIEASFEEIRCDIYALKKICADPLPVHVS